MSVSRVSADLPSVMLSGVGWCDSPAGGARPPWWRPARRCRRWYPFWRWCPPFRAPPQTRVPTEVCNRSKSLWCASHPPWSIRVDAPRAGLSCSNSGHYYPPLPLPLPVLLVLPLVYPFHQGHTCGYLHLLSRRCCVCVPFLLFLFLQLNIVTLSSTQLAWLFTFFFFSWREIFITFLDGIIWIIILDILKHHSTSSIFVSGSIVRRPVARFPLSAHALFWPAFQATIVLSFPVGASEIHEPRSLTRSITRPNPFDS